MGISIQEWKPGMQNSPGAPRQLREAPIGRYAVGVDPELDLEGAKPGATRPVGATPGRPATAVRRRVAATLVAATASVSLLAVLAGTADARPLPGDGASPSCRVDVRSSDVAGGLARHLFVIYYERGREKYFRGGPSKGGGSSGSTSSPSDSSSSDSSSSSSHSSSPSSGSSPYGPITTIHGDYKPGTIDYDRKAPSVTVLTGAGACGKDRCFATQAQRINKLNRGYKPLGPNSNSVAHTFLARCKVPAKTPGGWAPGWGQVL